MIIELLTQKGFVQGVDYSFDNGEIVLLPKVRLIEHAEVPAVLDAEGVEIEPAKPAYTEEETYYESLPSLAELKAEAVRLSDPAMLIGEYLKGKQVFEEDSLNLDLFLSGQDGWRFREVPAPSIDDLFNLIEPVKSALTAETLRRARINAGAAARIACEKVLDLIAGFNLEQSLSMEQITQMQQTFEMAERALRAGRPSLAKGAISMIEPDGVLVTAEMKTEALELLKDF